jgi:hypothetical protein
VKVGRVDGHCTGENRNHDSHQPRKEEPQFFRVAAQSAALSVEDFRRRKRERIQDVINFIVTETYKKCFLQSVLAFSPCCRHDGKRKGRSFGTTLKNQQIALLFVDTSRWRTIIMLCRASAGRFIKLDHMREHEQHDYDKRHTHQP